jgi:hypothetical protein
MAAAFGAGLATWYIGRMASEPLAVPGSRTDLLDLFWRYGGGAYAAIGLALLLAVTLALAAIFPQQPAGLTPTAAEVWLSTTAAGYGGLGPSLRALGLFQVFSGLWLRIVLGLLAYHCLLRLAAAVTTAWRAWRGPAWSLPPASLAAEMVTPPGTLAEITSRAAAILSAARYARPLTEQVPPGYLVVEGTRRRPAAIGPVLAYLGLLVLLFALFIDGMAGWTAGDVALAPGNAGTLPGQANLQVQLESISGPNDRPTSTVLLTGAGGRAARTEVAQNRPAFWGSLWLAERATGPALAVSGVDASGGPVLLQTSDAGGRAGQAANVLFTATQTEQVFAAPARNIAFRVVNYPALPERGIPEPVFLVEAYRGSDPAPVLSQLVREQTSLTLDNITYTFKPERHVVLALAYVPGAALLALGALLLLTGILLSFWWGGAKTWISLTERAGQALSLVRTSALLESECEQAALAAALQAGPDGSVEKAETQATFARNESA